MSIDDSQEHNILSERVLMTDWPAVLETSTPAPSSDRMVLASQLQARAADSEDSEDASDDDVSDNVARIGIVLANSKYKCNLLQCAHKTFNRPAELRRHHSTIHATQRPEFWCTVSSCTRSAAGGGEAFRRKYRLRDHMRKVHNGGGPSGTTGAAQVPNNDVSGFLAS